MRTIRVRNLDRDVELGDRILLADRWWPRLRGLIGRPEPDEGEGMLIVPSQGVHMYWMKYAIDVALLDRDHQIVAVYHDLQPGKRTRMHRAARCALELPTGTLERTGTAEGDRLEWVDSGQAAA